MDDAPLVINSPLRARTSASGKTRYTIDIKSEPIIHDLRDETLGATVAAALAHALRTRILDIATEASTATMARRKTAAIAIARGEPWATKRYSGGKLGLMPPTLGSKAFNDSGRFARSIAAAFRGGKWIVNVAANRLNPDLANVERIWSRLVELVPAFGQPQMLAEDDGVQAAIGRGIEAAIVKANETRDELSAARIRAYLSIAQKAIAALKSIAA